MVQKGYCDNVIDLFMYIFKKTVNKHHQLLYEPELKKTDLFILAVDIGRYPTV